MDDCRLEPDAARGQRVHGWGGRAFVSVTADVIGAERVNCDEQDVRTGR